MFQEFVDSSLEKLGVSESDRQQYLNRAKDEGTSFCYIRKIIYVLTWTFIAKSDYGEHSINSGASRATRIGLVDSMDISIKYHCD